MPDLDFRQISPTGVAPRTRIADAGSLNNIVKKIVLRDLNSALLRMDVQASIDGKPPFEEGWARESGQEGRCNLNFNDMKRRVKREQLGYYDLTDSVPTLVQVNSTAQVDLTQRTNWNAIKSEEFHRLIKDWSSFDTYFQLLVTHFVNHGLGFTYFEDDVNWKWRVSGLMEFKLPRGTTLAEEEIDIACAFRDIPVSLLYKWVANVPEDDKRWNKQEVYKAILKAIDRNIIYSVGEWEKWQQIIKNNDIYWSTTAQDTVKLCHAWVREYSGKVSQYLTLRNGENDDFLFKCENRFDNVNQCFTFFPYEVGTNGTLHSVRGLAHEIYPQVQVLNTLRCQLVDNAKLAGSLLLQPKDAQSAEDLAIMFYGGATYIPPGVTVANGQLNNPSQSVLPVLQDMNMLLQGNSPPVNTDKAGPEKTKFQIQKEAVDEAALPTASLNLFYQPWKRHLNEVWRRVNNPQLKRTDPGGEEAFAYRERCIARGVPQAFIMDKTSWVEPVRAIGYGSPGNRLMALDEFMQYYGSLDAVGQNNLLRDRFAQKVGYAQVDRFVPPLPMNGRMPMDSEIAECQNAALSIAGGPPVTVLPNDHHILHLNAHFPSIELDLDNMEAGQGSPQLLQVAQAKIQHIGQHMRLLKPDKLNGAIVQELTRRFNNDSERVSAAMDHAARQEQKRQAELEQAASENSQQNPKVQQQQELHQQKMTMAQETHQQKLQMRDDEANQKRAIRDQDQAQKARQQAVEARLRAANQSLGKAA